MPQCESHHHPYPGAEPFRCVMEAGHPVPWSVWPDGKSFDHNWGGLGPYTPRMTSKGEELNQAYETMESDK